MLKKIALPALALSMMIPQMVKASVSPDIATPLHRPEDRSIVEIQYGVGITLQKLGLAHKHLSCAGNLIPLYESRKVIEQILAGVGFSLGTEDHPLDRNKDGIVTHAELDQFVSEAEKAFQLPKQEIIHRLVKQYFKSLEASMPAVCHDYFPQTK